jgi:hypothetical protein
MSYIEQNWITAKEMDELIQTFFGDELEANGFNKVKKRRWVRSRVPEIRDVFEFVSISHSLNPRWGFSLDFCPRVKGDTLKWHRTEKSAQIDVVYDPIDYVIAPSNEFYDWLLSKTQPKEKTTIEAQAVAGRALPQALNWLAQVNSLKELETVLQKKQSEKVRRFGYNNYVQQPLALALVQARLGDVAKAMDSLDAYIKKRETPVDAALKLKSLLVKPSN